MEKIFNYKEKASFSYFYPAIAFIIIAALCAIFEYGIAFRNFRLLAYPNSVYVTGGIAVLFLVYAFYKMSRARQSKNNPFPIKFEGVGFSFPKGGDKEFVVFDEIDETGTDHDEDDGDSYFVVARGKRFEFFEERFDSKAEYAEFVEMVEAGKKR